jgi:hypothetical protein
MPVPSITGNRTHKSELFQLAVACSKTTAMTQA